MAKALVIGMGEVGEALWKMLVKAYGATDIKARDVKFRWPGYTFEFLHICFPQEINFIDTVIEYVKEYHPKHVIIHSTVSPGMTQRIQHKLVEITKEGEFAPMVYFSPVNGNTRDGLEWGLKTYTKYIAPADYISEWTEKAVDHLLGAGFTVEVIKDPDALELAKLLDLCWYGLNIAFYQDVERILTDEQYQILKNFMTMINEKSQGKVPRIVYYGGYIGGHCVIPAIEKIISNYSGCGTFEILKDVLLSNIKRKDDLMHRKPAHHP